MEEIIIDQATRLFYSPYGEFFTGKDTFLEWYSDGEAYRWRDVHLDRGKSPGQLIGTSNSISERKRRMIRAYLEEKVEKLRNIGLRITPGIFDDYLYDLEKINVEEIVCLASIINSLQRQLFLPFPHNTFLIS